MGGMLLWAVAAGLIVICLWQVIMAATGREEFDGWKKVLKRLSSAGRAVVDQALSQLIQWPGGPWILAAMALGFAAYAVFCFLWAKHPKFS